MMHLLTALRARLVSERGATMVEYGIMIALVAVVALAAVTALGLDVWGAFDTAQANVNSPAGPAATSPPVP